MKGVKLRNRSEERRGVELPYVLVTGINKTCSRIRPSSILCTGVNIINDKERGRKQPSSLRPSYLASGAQQQHVELVPKYASPSGAAGATSASGNHRGFLKQSISQQFEVRPETGAVCSAPCSACSAPCLACRAACVSEA